jgi:precorrin-4 methylase
MVLSVLKPLFKRFNPSCAVTNSTITVLEPVIVGLQTHRKKPKFLKRSQSVNPSIMSANSETYERLLRASNYQTAKKPGEMSL